MISPSTLAGVSATIDAIVISRKTCQTVLTFPKWPYAKPVFVLTSKPDSDGGEKSRTIRDEGWT